MKQIFFKTVRSDYTSTCATGILERKYQVGKRYRFHKDRPAYCFLHEDESLVFNYMRRKEDDKGNRVLICYGNLEEKEIPVVQYWYDHVNKKIRLKDLFNLNNSVFFYPTHFVSTDFTVIGEIYSSHSSKKAYAEDKKNRWPKVVR